MIVYQEEIEYPVSIKVGDVLFLSADGAYANPKFEHVAIILDDADAASEEDVGLCETYGMPESMPENVRGGSLINYRSLAHNGLAIWEHTGKYEIPIGREGSGWNLICRFPNLPEVDLLSAKYRILAHFGNIKYRGKFPASNVDGCWHCNCLAFVDLFYQFAGLETFSLPFPSYRSPFMDNQMRDFPSPGHLAHVMVNQVPLPYVPKSSDEATAFSRVSSALTTARKKGTPEGVPDSSEEH